MNIQVIFLLELFAVLCFGWWGFHASDNVWIRLLLGVGTPAIFIKFWMVFMAPKARRRISPDNARIIVRLILFSLAAFALAANGPFLPAAIFEALVALSAMLAIIWEQ